MAKCDICGKTPRAGKNVSFSQKRTNRVFKPNIQTTFIQVDGQTKRVRACTRCMRSLTKPGRYA